MDQFNMEKNDTPNWLFSNPVLNHCIPYPTDGHKIFGCIECGDKFIFESSYEYHINREVVQITFMCKACNAILEFKNRCKFLQHLRLHITKSITINYCDLTLNPLPMENFFQPNPKPTVIYKNPTFPRVFYCVECKESRSYNSKEDLYQVRAEHYGRYTGQNYTCTVCLYTLPNNCALLVHMEVHLNQKPSVCCDCGKTLSQKNVVYPFNHECDGFRAMRVSARIQCPKMNCQSIHPNEFRTHIMETHFSPFYNCNMCCKGLYAQDLIEKHAIETHNTKDVIQSVYICDICNLGFDEDQLRNHLKNHYKENFVYPCWDCHEIFNGVRALLAHAEICELKNENISNTIKLFTVKKTCEKCKRAFYYKCRHTNIESLPKNCPHCFTPKDNPKVIKCPMCPDKVNTSDIADHFEKFHNTTNMSPKVLLNRCDSIEDLLKVNKISKTSKTINRANKKETPVTSILKSFHPKQCIRKTSGAQWKCVKCDGISFTNKALFEQHLRLSHKDSNASYQCLECGECFIVKRSFATHMKIEHNVTDIDIYIFVKKCYTEEEPPSNTTPLIVLNEFQCRICLEQFQNDEDLRKHFRIHGMAFLLENRNCDKNPLVNVDSIEIYQGRTGKPVNC